MEIFLFWFLDLARKIGISRSNGQIVPKLALKGKMDLFPIEFCVLSALGYILWFYMVMHECKGNKDKTSKVSSPKFNCMAVYYNVIKNDTMEKL